MKPRYFSLQWIPLISQPHPKGVGVRDSNEDKVLAILEALTIFSHSFQGRSIVECVSFNAISQVSLDRSRGPWEL